MDPFSGLGPETPSRYKTQVTGHCFTNTEGILNNHKRGSYMGVCRMAHEQRKQRITDHGYQNFIFPNNESKKVKDNRSRHPIHNSNAKQCKACKAHEFAQRITLRSIM